MGMKKHSSTLPWLAMPDALIFGSAGSVHLPQKNRQTVFARKKTPTTSLPPVLNDREPTAEPETGATAFTLPTESNGPSQA
jgi:hypothetical protein